MDIRYTNDNYQFLLRVSTLIFNKDESKVLLYAKNNLGYKELLKITTLVNTMNIFDLLKYDSLVVTKDAVKKLEEVYA